MILLTPRLCQRHMPYCKRLSPRLYRQRGVRSSPHFAGQESNSSDSDSLLLGCHAVLAPSGSGPVAAQSLLRAVLVPRIQVLRMSEDKEIIAFFTPWSDRSVATCTPGDEEGMLATLRDFLPTDLEISQVRTTEAKWREFMNTNDKSNL